MTGEVFSHFWLSSLCSNEQHSSRIHLFACFLSCFSFLELISASIKAFATVPWQFYIAHGLGIVGFCKFGLTRSLLSKTVETGEVGKMFSVLSVFSSAMPMLGNPVFRQLYHYTMSTLPSAIFIVFGVLQIITFFSTLFVYLKRSEIQNGEDKQDLNGSAHWKNTILSDPIREANSSWKNSSLEKC